MNKRNRVILLTLAVIWTIGLQAQEILNYTDRPGQSFTSYVLNQGDFMVIGGWDQLGRTTQQHWENATFGSGSSFDLRYDLEAVSRVMSVSRIPPLTRTD